MWLFNKNTPHKAGYRVYSRDCRLVEFDFAGDFHVVCPDEVENRVADRSGFDVGFDAAQSVESRSRGLVEVTVGFGSDIDVGFVKAVVAGHDGAVDAIVGHRVVCHDDKGRNTRRDSASAFDEGPFADFGTFVEDDGRRKNCMVVDKDITCNLDSVTEHTGTDNVGVVTDVGFGKDETVVANSCAAIGVDAAVDDDLLADDVVVSDIALGLFTRPAEVLGVGTNDGTLIDFVVFAYACSRVDGHVGHDFTSLPYLYIGIDVGKGVDGDTIGNFGRWVDMSEFADHGYFLGDVRVQRPPPTA